MLAANPKFKSPSVKWIAVPLLLLALLGAFLGWRTWHGGSPAVDPTIVPTNPAIEERWGIRVSQINVTADGGLVDFRYIVLDADKALAMLQATKNLPVLTAEADGRIVNSAALMTTRHNLQPGLTYFLLYRNTNGAIKPGGAVTVTLGDLKLEHVIAR
jgi:hypothetical protein